MPLPTYVVHDEKCWRVLEETIVDGDPAYLASKMNGPTIVIRKSECQPWTAKPRRKTWRDTEGHVLESDGRTVTIRRKNSSTRYPTSLQAIYTMTVKLHIANERIKRLRAKGKRV